MKRLNVKTLGRNVINLISLTFQKPELSEIFFFFLHSSWKQFKKLRRKKNLVNSEMVIKI